jgi:hypothetical protein
MKLNPCERLNQAMKPIRDNIIPNTLSIGIYKAFIRAFFSYTRILVHPPKNVTFCNRSSIATLPAAHIDPPETGDWNYV